MREVTLQWLQSLCPVQGRRVLDVGSLDVNGSPRELVLGLGAAEYVGADLQPGPNVDVVCDAADLVEQFGAESFGTVLCLDTLEHVEDWRSCLLAMKQVCRREGHIMVVAPSPGSISRHNHPNDYWRFELGDLLTMFHDFAVQATALGSLLIAQKPVDWQPVPLPEIQLFEVV